MRSWLTVLVGVVLTSSVVPLHSAEVAAWQMLRADPPNVVGLSYADAVATLRAWQPLVEVVVPSGVPAGADPTLLTVDHEGGDETSVYLSLVTAMPGVVGMTIDEAAPTLAAHGIRGVLDPAGVSGASVIDSQAPDAGTTVRIDNTSGGTSDGRDGLPAAVVTLRVAVVVSTPASPSTAPTTVQPPQPSNTTADTGSGPEPALTDYGGGAQVGGSTDEASRWTSAAVFSGGGLGVLLVLIVVGVLSAKQRRRNQLAQPAFPPSAARLHHARPAQQPRREPRLTTRVRWPPSALSVNDTGAAHGQTLTVQLHIDPTQPTLEEVPS